MEREKKHQRTAFAFMKTSNKMLDITDPERLQQMENKNHSLLYRLYLNSGEKEKALELLTRTRRSKYSIAQINEIIYLHLYFKDYAAAMECIQRYNGTVVEIAPIEALIQIHLADKTRGCADTTVFWHVANGIKIYYDGRLVESLIDFYKSACNGCFTKCIEQRLGDIEKVIVDNHYDKLTYKDAKYLYTRMPDKKVFLKRMVETNPFIRRRFYFEYAEIYGIRREDICRILAVNCTPWALSLALFHGWVDEALRERVDTAIRRYPSCLNGKGDWKWDFTKMIDFSKKHE